MPKKGDSFTIILKKTHLEWGTHRKTNSRKMMSNESYIPIPVSDAKRIGIYNSNYATGLGNNEFNVVSKTRKKLFEVKTTGSKEQGDIYAKNIQGNGDLSLINSWLISQNAKIGDKVKVTWVSSTDIELEII